MLSTKDLSIGYGSRIVQKCLNLDSRPGDLICLLGTNGSGKSTLIRTLSGLQKKLGGEVYIGDKRLDSIQSEERAKLISLVLTEAINSDRMSVEELVTLGRFPHTDWAGRISEKDKRIVQTALKQVNLTDKASRQITSISDGEKQRAVIAKALTQETPLVMLDEPTAHLDLPNRIEIMLLLRKLSVNLRKTFILSTHELELAMQMADKIWLLTPNGMTVSIPEDLMLSGELQRAFGNDSFYFDPNDGHYRIKPIMGNLAVSVDGETNAVTWLVKALNRCGIRVIENADISIYAKLNSFFITKNDVKVDCSSIEETINQLFLLPH